MENPMANVEEFLRELTQLSHRYRLGLEWSTHRLCIFEMEDDDTVSAYRLDNRAGEHYVDFLQGVKSPKGE